MSPRLYLDPEPDHGPHPGYRGDLRLTDRGVWVDSGCEWLVIDDSVSGWPDSEWGPVEQRTLIPWHRVHEIGVLE